MTGNLGHTAQRRRRTANPMARYDALPQPLRRWMADAALPWSATSCLRLWQRAQQRGTNPTEALNRAQANALRRERRF
ncbi:DUF6525 family protein [Paracoccus sp. (in: a-proteobacteria)]|uniref:DUF6525 family protein n=1 Tax=Paracoccus sp. TaxID=267 RepID=UPI0026E0FAD7|nr:DUF6525 family protein [Paracoccus sp. (in: a-proteobacteria)]MDO5646811.1 DUF6525 family protein [Paracoccus sp. (in: a-proteobacteria)]